MKQANISAKIIATASGRQAGMFVLAIANFDRGETDGKLLEPRGSMYSYVTTLSDGRVGI